MNPSRDTFTVNRAYRSASAVWSVLLGIAVLASCGGPAVRHQPIPVPRPGGSTAVAADAAAPATPTGADAPTDAAAGGPPAAASKPAGGKPKTFPKAGVPGPKATGEPAAAAVPTAAGGAAAAGEPAAAGGAKAPGGPSAANGAAAAGEPAAAAAASTTPSTTPATPTAAKAPKANKAPAAAPPVDAAAWAARRPLAHLDLHETGGQFRADEPLRHGVPFARGAVFVDGPLRAWRDDDGRPLPIQTRVLSRWSDGSLRWVLVETRADVQSGGHTPVAVGLAADIPADPARFHLRREPDGQVLLDGAAGALPVLQPSPSGDRLTGLSAVLVDRFEHPYLAHFDPDSAELLEDGPLRAVVRLTGEHRGLDEDGLPIPFHSVSVLLHLMPDRATALVEWTLENTPLHDPPGRLAFRSYMLSLDAPEGVTEIELPGRRVPATQAVRQLQVDDRGALSVDGEPAPAPAPADLWMGLRAGVASLHVHRVESLQNHPAGLWWKPGSPLRVELLPRLGQREYFLDDATRKTFRLHLVYGAGDAGASRMQRLADPAHASLDPAEVAASGAWGDAGALYVPGPGELQRGPNPPRDAPTGWADWGEASATNTHQSGSPRNRLSVFLEAVQARSADLFRWARSRAWHAMDLRPYHIAGFDADAYPDANLYEGVPHPNERAALRLGRSEMDARFPEYKQGLPEDGHGYNGFDPEHMTLDDVYECWLLTGDWLARDALRSAGEAMLTWKEVRPDGEIHSSRTFGWTLRALVQVFRATGEVRYLDAARALVARADAERGRGDVKYLRRMPPDARHIADRESDDPWMVAVALHGLSAYWGETEDPLVPPMMADLSAFCLSAFRGGGFLPDVPLDGSPPPGQVTSPLGVGSWVPGALAAAAFVTGDPRPVDAVIGYYALLRARPDRPVAFGGRDWPWWQAYLVSLEQRHGRAAVEDPGSLLPPGPR